VHRCVGHRVFRSEARHIAESDTVAMLGAGPTGLYAAKSAWLMGAGRVLVIDHLEDRLEKARTSPVALNWVSTRSARVGRYR
jgi:threonine dehydrogenase-like Zn-dependent dehydrogenase